MRIIVKINFKIIILRTLQVLFAAYVVIVIVRLFYFLDKHKTDDQVAKIHATKLTLDDVMGKDLPPDPGAEADKTIQGIDANKNGIRDDVELAIFRSYPNSAKTRAVMLQYALALQMEMTQPFLNTDVVTAVAEDGDRALKCVWSIVSRDDMQNFLKITGTVQGFVKNKQLNTLERKKYQVDFYEYLRTYNSPNEGCDLNIASLDS